MPVTRSPNETLAAEAKAAARVLSRLLRLQKKSAVRFQPEGAGKTEAAILPRVAVELLVQRALHSPQRFVNLQLH